MFSVGDKVVCNTYDIKGVELNKIYTVKYIWHYSSEYVTIFLEENRQEYKIEDFISLKEYRKKKINKIFY